MSEARERDFRDGEEREVWVRIVCAILSGSEISSAGAVRRADEVLRQYRDRD